MTRTQITTTTPAEFALLRQTQLAYRDALNGRTTSFVLSPDSGFFRFFENSDGASAKPGPAAPATGSK